MELMRSQLVLQVAGGGRGGGVALPSSPLQRGASQDALTSWCQVGHGERHRGDPEPQASEEPSLALSRSAVYLPS